MALASQKRSPAAKSVIVSFLAAGSLFLFPLGLIIPFDEAFRDAALMLFWVWFFSGCLLFYFSDRPAFVGLLGPVVAVVTVLATPTFVPAPSPILACWLVYLTLLTVYYAFLREEVGAEERFTGLFHHGLALTTVILWGAGIKITYWLADPFGFPRWKARMAEYMPFFSIEFGAIALATLGWFHIAVISSRRERFAKQQEEEQATTPAPEEEDASAPAPSEPSQQNPD
jgi:hypothetical protein